MSTNTKLQCYSTVDERFRKMLHFPAYALSKLVDALLSYMCVDATDDITRQYKISLD